MKALVECGAEVIALSRTEADLHSLKQEVHYNVFCTCMFVFGPLLYRNQ